MSFRADSAEAADIGMMDTLRRNMDSKHHSLFIFSHGFPEGKPADRHDQEITHEKNEKHNNIASFFIVPPAPLLKLSVLSLICLL